ncbi:MAG: Hsp70 family protein [Planctomycetaceae bacterium]
MHKGRLNNLGASILSGSRKTVAVGIDLGTTRSVVAHLDATGRPLTVQNLEGDATTPTVVFFDRNAIVVGREALKVAEYEPDRVAQFAKRHFGKANYTVNVAGQKFPPEVIQALVLKKLKEDAQHRLGHLDKCVVTVPAYFNEPRRKATQDAGRMAGLEVVDIINEPTAAALAFGVQQGFVNAEGRTEQLETVLVYDLGGGTFDVTLMEILGNDYKAIATAGDVYLGGIDWDQRIVDTVAEQFVIQFGSDPRQDPAHRQRLLTEAEDAKRSLSQREEVVIRFAMDGNRIQVPLNRATFENLCGDLLDRTMFTTRRLLKDADRRWSDVSRLLLVGGSSRMPMVQAMLEAESGLTVDRSLSADESVAHGAAIYAGILLNTDDPSASRITVSNVNSHDLGILGVDSQSGQARRSIMIPRNTTLPVKRAKRFTTSRDNQASVAVNVVEGGDDQGRHSTAVGKCVVRDLPAQLPKATAVEVIFNYQQDGRLMVVAQLPTVGRKAALTIERGSGLSDEEISSWADRIDAGTLTSDNTTDADTLPSAPEATDAPPEADSEANGFQFGDMAQETPDFPDFSAFSAEPGWPPVEDIPDINPTDEALEVIVEADDDPPEPPQPPRLQKHQHRKIRRLEGSKATGQGRRRRMSERMITVSNGEDFFRIPLADLPEASADGFYVPSLNGRAIVTDGTEIFEIPAEDLPEAEADGFRDALIKEQPEIAEAQQMLATIAAQSASAPAAQTPPPPNAVAPPAVSPAASTVHAVQKEKNVRATKSAAAAVAAQVLASSEISNLPQAEEPETDGSAISKFLLPAHSVLGDKSTWQVMLLNAGLHGLILLLLALIILPAPEFDVFMEITSAFEPEDPVEMQFESVDLAIPTELEVDPVKSESFSQFEVDSPDTVDIDMSDVEVSIPDQLIQTDMATGPPTTNSKSEMGGRSKAGRSALVAQRGGNAASEAAVMQGLSWMARHQYPDGGWSYDHSQGECKGQCSQPGQLAEDCRTAATGMALLAMLGAGNTPFEGDFQEEVRNGITFLLKNANPVPAGLDMRSKHANNTGMYTQAIAATALCEILAMTKHEYDSAKSGKDKEQRELNTKRFQLMKQVRPAAQAAITFIVSAQDQRSGGWGYNPGEGRTADTSILGWQVMALKAAAHAEIPFPGSTIVNANRFLTSVQTEDGWFGYRGPEKKESTTAIGIISRMLSGMDRNHPLLKLGVGHLAKKGPVFGNMYYNYYATQVMLHYGGEEWQKWNAKMRDHLVATQIKEGHAAGSWNLSDAHGARGGRLYMTALCVMTLEVYYRHLPLYGEPGKMETGEETVDAGKLDGEKK